MHHPPNAGDSPSSEYVPTLFSVVGKPDVSAWYPLPGAFVSAACPRWTCANVAARTAGKKEDSSAPVISEADKALEGVAATLALKLPGGM